MIELAHRMATAKECLPSGCRRGRLPVLLESEPATPADMPYIASHLIQIFSMYAVLRAHKAHIALFSTSALSPATCPSTWRANLPVQTVTKSSVQITAGPFFTTWSYV